MVAIESYKGSRRSSSSSSSADAVSYDDADHIRLCGCVGVSIQQAAALVEATNVLTTLIYIVYYVYSREFGLLPPLGWLLIVHVSALFAALLRRGHLYAPLYYSTVS